LVDHQVLLEGDTCKASRAPSEIHTLKFHIYEKSGKWFSVIRSAIQIPQEEESDMYGTSGISRGVVLLLILGCAPMPIQERVDKPRASGYIHVRPLYLRSAPATRPPMNAWQNGLLSKALADCTDVVAEGGSAVALDDPQLLELPWAALPMEVGTTLEARDMTSSELAGLGKYLASGGLLVTSPPRYEDREKMRRGIFDVLRQALATQRLNEGSGWQFIYLKPSHPIFHSAIKSDGSGHSGEFIGLRVGERLAASLGYGGINSVVYAMEQQLVR
jgi:hypothetical protein